ncbi:MAG: ABC transporter ATP-binding protein [Simkania sp.]|nr:ABC transporter ATP-binding protein [Simkania sp.]
MRLLFQAALRSKAHLPLLIFVVLTLLGLTVANQLEMFALGIISNTGADFFALFSHAQEGAVALSDVQTQWSSIDVEGTGLITKKAASAYMAAQKQGNPLQWVMGKLSADFNLDSSFQALIFVLVCVALFKAIWLFFSRYTSQLLAIRVSRDLRQQYFKHIQSLPMSFYQEYNIGSLSSRVVVDANQISSSMNSLATNLLQMPFTLVSTLSLCFYLSWKLSLVIFIGVPLIILPIIVLAKRVKRVSRQLQTNQEKFASVLIDFLAGIQTVKIFSMEPFSLKKYQEQNEKMAMLEAKNAKYGLLTRPILHMITTFCLASVVIVGLHTLHMTMSQLIVFCGLLHLLYEPVKKFAEENTNIQRGIVAAERMFDVLHLKSHIEDQPQAIELSNFSQAIEFDHVWFRYEGEWILKDVSFTVRKGETVAIVGPTGAGKSTIVQLIPRLFDVQKGDIKIDGRSVSAYTQKSLRQQIAFVAQKPFLFYDTVLANISYGCEHTEEDIERAAKRANADEFIERLPQKYNTMLAEGGQNLSGGQQQRLAIARALFKNAPVLILDEATSSLDALSELKIKQAITGLHGEITQIIIAHRLTTIEHADRIIYLERGEKIAEGTREELLVSCPQFRLMWETHFQTMEDLATI